MKVKNITLVTAFFILCITQQVKASLITFSDELLDSSLISTVTNFSFNESSVTPGEFVLAFNGGTNDFGDQSTVNLDNNVGGELRQITTVGFDFSTGGSIGFDLLIGNDTTTAFGFFEEADTTGNQIAASGLVVTGEDIGLFFSTDGGTTFDVLQIFDTDAPETLGQFGTFNINLPIEAQTSNTIFQILQLDNSGIGFDDFAIDNFLIAPTNTSTDVPEPSTFALLGLALIGIAIRRRKVK